MGLQPLGVRSVDNLQLRSGLQQLQGATWCKAIPSRGQLGSKARGSWRPSYVTSLWDALKDNTFTGDHRPDGGGFAQSMSQFISSLCLIPPPFSFLRWHRSLENILLSKRPLGICSWSNPIGALHYISCLFYLCLFSAEISNKIL